MRWYVRSISRSIWHDSYWFTFIVRATQYFKSHFQTGVQFGSIPIDVLIWLYNIYQGLHSRYEVGSYTIKIWPGIFLSVCWAKETECHKRIFYVGLNKKIFPLKKYFHDWFLSNQIFSPSDERWNFFLLLWVFLNVGLEILCRAYNERKSVGVVPNWTAYWTDISTHKYTKITAFFGLYQAVIKFAIPHYWIINVDSFCTS